LAVNVTTEQLWSCRVIQSL